MLYLRLLLFVFCFVGCASNQRVTQTDLTKLDTRSAVIFIPGYYGSALKDKSTGSRTFITSSQVLFGSEPLNLYGEELGLGKKNDSEAEGVLKSISVVPVLYSVDVYGDFLSELSVWAAENNRQLIPVAYDWRDDLVKATKRIDELVLSLKKSGVQRIDLVAHSMGGLVSSYYLAYGSQEPEGAVRDWRGAKLVNRFVVMGTPFGGVFSVFRNMQRGAVLAGNKKLFPAETIATYPSCYQLLPYQTASAINADGSVQMIPIAEFNFWKRQNLGLMRKPSSNSNTQANREEFSRMQLSRARQFSDRVHAPHKSGEGAPKEFKVLSLVGEGVQTVATAFLDKNANFIFDSDEIPKQFDRTKLFEDGDGTVTRSSAKLPPAYAPYAKVMKTKQVHERVFADKAFQKELAEFLK